MNVNAAAQKPSSGHAAPAPLTLTLLPADRRADAGALWRRAQQQHDGGLLCSWEWTGTWLDHYGDAVDHVFAIGERAGTPVAATLITRGVGRSRGPLRLRTVHLGTAGEDPGESVYVEYNRPLVREADRAEFARMLLDAMRDLWRWDEIHVEGLAPDVAEDFVAAEPRLSARREICRVVDLRAARDRHGCALPSLPGKRHLRRDLRRAQPVDSEWATTTAQALDIFDELVELHQRRWTARGFPGAFARPRFCAFHRSLIERRFEHGAVVLFRAVASGQTLGCMYAHVDGDRVLGYQTGMADRTARCRAPGIVTRLLFTEACLDRGYSEYDTLAGDRHDKREMTNTARHLVWLSLRRPSPKWRAVDGLAAARRRVRDR